MKVSVYFNKQRMKPDGSIPIFICVKHPSKRFYFNSGLTATQEFNGEIFPRTEKNYRAKTLRLSQILSDTEEIALNNALMSLDQLKSKILASVMGVEEKFPTLVDYMKQFAETKHGHTKDLYLQTVMWLERYDKDADFSINTAWLEDFEREMAKTIRPNTISIHMRNLRATFNWAIRNDWTDNYPFSAYKLPFERTKKRNLSIKEIATLRDMECNYYQGQYRDFFMLSFYLIGINTTDLLSVTHAHVHDGRLEYQRAKTHKWYSIKIEPEAEAIIQKYIGEKHLLSFGDTRTAHQMCMKANLHLDKLMKGVTTYYARHSWATIAYSLGISKDVISQALGHSMGPQVTEIYIERDPKLVDEANRKVIDALNNCHPLAETAGEDVESV